ncbi:MAG: exodeoxyribonuclease VII large subunit [Clostridia bacterium]|nr:exodeoxyribonuclease VII large subunit [Clostridia bacterium]
MSEKQILTITELNEYIKLILDNTPRLNDVWVKGEISNFTNHYKTGHFYLTLKDQGSLIKAVMFKSRASQLKFIPENGMKVIARGRVASFVRDGQYQLYIDELEPDGVGVLYIAFEQLKNKLAAEGLFREDLKRPLPKIPTRIGIVTSPTGAAIRDIINILGRRFPYAKVILYPSLVQGDDAPPQIVAGIRYFNEHKLADVLIVGRGGGSIEDLWAFNDENVARAVRASQIPVISAVGHETDFTICDFAADRRAPTPSAAAELAVPDTPELKRKIGNIIGRMDLLISSNIKHARTRLALNAEKQVLRSPGVFVDEKRMAVVASASQLDSAMKLKLTDDRARFAQTVAKLQALDPMAVISRGYSAVFKEDGTLIKSASQLEIGESISFKTSDGSVKAEVIEKQFNRKSNP